MPRPRGQANQALYRARILLRGWETLQREGTFPSPATDLAFRPAVQTALREAYGWFLLAVAGVEDTQQSEPPVSCNELPATEAGRARPPELAEFEQLERSGWLAELLQDYTAVPSPTTAPGNALLVSDRAPPERASVARWADQLHEIMRRMDDSLSEC